MAGRKIPLATNEFYHVYNRGVARQPTFLTKWDYQQTILALSYYRFTTPPIKLSRFKELPYELRKKYLSELENKGEKLVDIISFVLMPNHFHFLLKQTVEGGIAKFLSQVTNSYTRYFNTKHKRVGPLFQGTFKAVHIETDEQLIHLSRYIHLNPLVSFVVKEKDFLTYPWSCLPDYLSGKSSLVELEPILSQFPSPSAYRKFVLDQADYAKRLEAIKHLVLEEKR